MTNAITTYGGGELFFLVFNAIAALFKEDRTGLLIPMIHLGLLVGSLYVVVLMLFQNQLIHGVRWLLWVIVATNLLFLPKTRIHIHDPLTTYHRDVDGVPLALGVFASFVSQLGKGVTEKLESVVTLPDYMPYHQTGTVFASSLMSQLRKFRIVDPVFKGNMERFVNQCVVYDAMIGHKYSLTDLQNTPNIWDLVTTHASPVLGFLYKEANTPGTLVSCRVGAQKLNALWGEAIRQATILYGSRIQTKDLTEAAFNTHLLGSARLFSNAATWADSAQNILRQEMMINAIQDGANNKLSELGGTANYGATKALLQQRSTYAIAGDIAARTLPLFKNVIEALSYALFVFIVVLALLPYGHRVLLTYMGILVWTQLWAPLYAVLNLIMTLYGRAETMAHGASQGLTLLNSSAIVNANVDMTTLAAWLSVSIPFISYGILRQGAAAFVGLAQHLGSAMQSAASSSSHEVVSGNISLGNITMGTEAYQNTSAFQHMTSPSFSDGEFKAMSASGIEQTTFASGGQALSDHGLSLTPVTLMASVNTSWEAQQRLHEAQSVADSKSKALGKSLESAIHQTASLLERVSADAFAHTTFSEATSSAETKALQTHHQLAEEIAQSLHVSKSVANELALYAQLGGTIKSAFSLGASGSLGGTMSNQEAIQKARNIAKSSGYTYNLDSAVASAKTLAEGHNDTQGVELAKNASTTFQEAHHLRAEASLAQTHVKELSTSLASSRRRDFQESRNVTQDFLEYVAHQPINPGPQGSSSNQEIGMMGALSILKTGGQAYQTYLDRFFEENPQYTLERISMDDASQKLDQAYQSRATSLSPSPSLEGIYENKAYSLTQQGREEGLKDALPTSLTPQVNATLETAPRKLQKQESWLRKESDHHHHKMDKAAQENIVVGNVRQIGGKVLGTSTSIPEGLTPPVLESTASSLEPSPQKQISQESKTSPNPEKKQENTDV